MSTRLATGGLRIDRGQSVSFRFNGQRMNGFAGDTLASALLANGQTLVGRSFKYHRPRGIVASGPEEPNALMGLGKGARFEPNARATTTELFDGLEAQSQNHWPSLGFDIGAINARLNKLFPAGFYYKTFMWPRSFWKHIYEPFIRKAAGLGEAPTEADADTYEQFYHSCDLLIVGGGVAGLMAALTAGRSGLRVLLIEEQAHWGGRSPVDGGTVEGTPVTEWIAGVVAELAAMENVQMRLRCMGAGVYDHGSVVAYQRLTDHLSDKTGPRHRLWRIRAGRIITATGAIERPLSFAGNDVPGVMLASAVRDFIVNYGVSPGDRVVIVTNNDDAYRTAFAVLEAGLEVVAVLDARGEVAGPMAERLRARGVRVAANRGIAGVVGGKAVRGVKVCAQAGEGAVLEELGCDVVAMSGGWSPVVHLWSHAGGKLRWDEIQSNFVPDSDRSPSGASGEAMVLAAGAANGAGALGSALQDGAKAAAAACAALGAGVTADAPSAETEPEAPMAAAWLMPQGAGKTLRAKMFLDYQNDVKVADVALAAQEGFESVEHTKRYTTLGMATDQGKLSNINGLAVLSKELNTPIPQVGTTTFRPPYHPISMGSIAGEASGALFQPIRKTPLHDWHEAHGVEWEPVGQWRRPYAYPRQGESTKKAVNREVKNTRQNVGLLDASTLGKILVKGPDAGRFLDMLYTNMMSTLKPGRCRYGLMCSENGFLMDDGVVARIDEDTFLCHTTSGGADHIHQHMEEWLQTEWWDWKVWVVNVTEEWGQIAVVGPKARAVLQAVGGPDLAALDFMGWAEGTLADIPVRAFRISFSGELSYEIAVPAGRAQELWDALWAAGQEHGVMPYGTEALHILRAEKGFIMIGDETDGTVIPQDLGLHWAISKKKDDYIGKRAQERDHLTDPERWQLVGLETEDGSVLPDGAYAAGAGTNANGQRLVEGRVTSTYWSETLQKGIAMGLVRRGPKRLGEVLSFPTTDGRTIRARIVDPVFFDPEGEKQNG